MSLGRLAALGFELMAPSNEGATLLIDLLTLEAKFREELMAPVAIYLAASWGPRYSHGMCYALMW